MRILAWSKVIYQKPVEVACGISKQPLADVVKPLAPYLVVMVIMLMLITYVPWISLVIPNLVYGK